MPSIEDLRKAEAWNLAAKAMSLTNGGWVTRVEPTPFGAPLGTAINYGMVIREARASGDLIRLRRIISELEGGKVGG